METMLQCWLAVACRDAAVKVQRLLAAELVDHEGFNSLYVSNKIQSKIS